MELVRCFVVRNDDVETVRKRIRVMAEKDAFLLTTLKVVYVLTTPMPELLENATVEAIRIRAKWVNDDYICRGHILNGMSDSLFYVYTNVESAKKLWDSLVSKYMAEDSSSKKFLVSNFNNYKMVDSRPVMEQYNELLRILGQYTQHGLKIDESIYVSSIIDKLPPSWKDFKHTLKHGKDDLSLVQLGSHLRIEESLRAQDSDKGKGKEVGGPSVNMTEEGKNKHNKENKGKKRSSENNSSSSSKKKPKLECWKCSKIGHFKRDCRSESNRWKDASVLYMGDDHFAPVHGKGSVVLEFIPDDSDSVYMSSSTVINSSLWHDRLGHVHYKRMLEMSKDDLIPAIDENMEKYDISRFCYVYLLHAKDEAMDKFRIYKTEVELQQNNLIKTLRTDRGDEYYDPVFFQSVGIIHETIAPYTPQAIVRLLDPKRKTLGEKSIDCIFVGYAEHSKAYRDDHSDDVPSKIPEPRKGKRVRKAKSYGSDFELYLVEGSRDHVGSQYSYCYSIEEDPRTYDEAMQYRDAIF
ncbi:zinc finger, CCHC-type containing protein [Tanacetum coccineum]|uniref:Zinc finger, CCHC-type containing protein n=1 Tax=Tanacetum coccineum TaxID=301880 RepID=A0ABQ4YFV0_9ASTR